MAEESPEQLSPGYLEEDKQSPTSPEYGDPERSTGRYTEDYGREGDLEMRQQLLDSKMAKKRAQEDAKVLANRIALLKVEEAKVFIIYIYIYIPKNILDVYN